MQWHGTSGSGATQRPWLSTIAFAFPRSIPGVRTFVPRAGPCPVSDRLRYGKSGQSTRSRANLASSSKALPLFSCMPAHERSNSRPAGSTV